MILIYNGSTHHLLDHTRRDPLQIPVLVVRERNKTCFVQFPVLLSHRVLLQPDGVVGGGVREMAPAAVLEDQVPQLEPFLENFEPEGSALLSILKENQSHYSVNCFNISYLGVIRHVQVVVVVLVGHGVSLWHQPELPVRRESWPCVDHLKQIH